MEPHCLRAANVVQLGDYDESVETDELLKRAWEAVEKSGVPESLQEVAFREAVETLRASSGPASTHPLQSSRDGDRQRSQSSGGKGKKSTAPSEVQMPDEATFFATLASESGVAEGDLRDVLQLKPNGTVAVTPPTRKLGDSLAQQAKTVIALVAGARAVGLGELPVDAGAVRTELERKRCYDGNNFAAKHLGPLRGFNAGSMRTEIVLTSQWVKDFSEAVERALGRGTEDTD